MPPLRHHCLALVLLAMCCGAHAAEVTIYRCTDAQGRLTLRDTPCPKGQQQQTREMLRPRDPPPRATPHAPAPTPPAVVPPTRFVVVTPPRPLYECVTADGETYTSDTDAGDPRWQPLWTLGFPLHAPLHRRFDHRPGGIPPAHRRDVRPAGLVFDSVGRPTPKPSGHRPGAPSLPPATGIVFATPGAWVRDECHPLPPQEVCARLGGRRYELDRRYNSALQGERTRITEEQRGIDARLANDCGVN